VSHTNRVGNASVFRSFRYGEYLTACFRIGFEVRRKEGRKERRKKQKKSDGGKERKSDETRELNSEKKWGKIKVQGNKQLQYKTSLILFITRTKFLAQNGGL